MSTRVFARVTDRQLRAWILRGVPVPRIAQTLGCSTESVVRRVQLLWRSAQERGNLVPPTESEIRQRCQEIQKTWSEEERQRRAGYCHAPVEMAVVPASALARHRPGWR